MLQERCFTTPSAQTGGQTGPPEAIALRLLHLERLEGDVVRLRWQVKR